MGTCVSKCYPSPTSTTELCDSSIHDTAATTTTTTTTAISSSQEATKPLSAHPSSPTPTTSTSCTYYSTISSGSSTSTATSTSSSSSSSSSLASSSSSSSSSRPPDRPFSSEFLRTCAKESSFDIVVLDPNKSPHTTITSPSPAPARHHHLPPRSTLPRPLPGKPPVPSSRSLGAARRTPSPRKPNAQLMAASKRARSVSPMSRAGCKKPCSSVKRAPSTVTEREAFLPTIGRHRVGGEASKKRLLSVKGQEQGPPAAVLEELLSNPHMSMDCFIFL